MEKQFDAKDNRFRRIVVKVGSNVLTRPDGTLDVTHMSALVDQLAELHRRGVEVILVSSGAVASGRGEVHPAQTLDDVSQRQLFSAVGQAKLMNRYYDLFRNYGIVVGQVLTTKESIATPRHYSNQRNCVEVMLQMGVLPIVNENDTVSITELMFTDNDELSGLMATMMQADALFLLSNVDGVYDGPPSSADASLIREVEAGKDLSDYIQPEKSGFGRGGMASKSSVARRVADEGITVFIANGRREGIILDLLGRPENVLCTRFVPRLNSKDS
jgi:glutamate 5-kinase